MNKFKVETYKSTEGDNSLLVLKAGDVTLVSRCGTYWSIIDDSTKGGYEVGARYIMLTDDHFRVDKGCVFEVEEIFSCGSCFTRCNTVVSAERLISGEVIKLEFHPMKFRVMNASHYYDLMEELTAHGYRFKYDGHSYALTSGVATKYLFTDAEGIIKWTTNDRTFGEDEREECELVNGTHHPHLHRTTNIVVK